MYIRDTSLYRRRCVVTFLTSHTDFFCVADACSALIVILLLEACTRIELVSWEWNSHILFQLDEHAIIGVPKRIWTAGPTLKRRMLYQLSYWHIYVQLIFLKLHIINMKEIKMKIKTSNQIYLWNVLLYYSNYRTKMRNKNSNYFFLFIFSLYLLETFEFIISLSYTVLFSPTI